jgi:hypothetical protein
MFIVTITPENAQAQYCVPCLYISAGTLRVVKRYYAINCAGSFSSNFRLTRAESLPSSACEREEEKINYFLFSNVGISGAEMEL